MSIDDKPAESAAVLKMYHDQMLLTRMTSCGMKAEIFTRGQPQIHVLEA